MPITKRIQLAIFSDDNYTIQATDEPCEGPINLIRNRRYLNIQEARDLICLLEEAIAWVELHDKIREENSSKVKL